MSTLLLLQWYFKKIRVVSTLGQKKFNYLVLLKNAVEGDALTQKCKGKDGNKFLNIDTILI